MIYLAISNRLVEFINTELSYLPVTESTPFTAVQPKIEEQGEGVTKIGNNTYFYSGAKGEGEAGEDATAAEMEQLEGDHEDNEGVMDSQDTVGSSFVN